MKISTRKEAIENNESQYFTGKKCKNGHLSYRYTSSGTCAECVAISSSYVRRVMDKDFRAARHLEREARNAKLQEFIREREHKQSLITSLVKIRLLAHNNADRDTLLNTAVQLCLATYPVLSTDDVRPNFSPVEPGSRIFAARVPEQHIEMMRQIEAALAKISGPNIAAIRRQALAAVEKMADDEARDNEPPVSFK